MKSDRRITILAGAGLIKDADFPTSVELASNLKSSLLELSDRDADSDSEIRDSELAKLHLATYRFLNGGIRFQQGILDSDPDASVNIEQLAIVAEELQARARNPLSPYTSGWHSRIVDLEREAQARGFDLLNSFVLFIYDQLGHWLDLDEDRVDRISYLRQIFEICNIEPKYAVDIFSLNYDLCIEYVL